MNKKTLEKKKHHLMIIGSARGINRFYITNKFIEKSPNATIISTSKLIKKIITEFDFPDLEHIPLINFSKIVEPALTQTVLAHLEHNDVILDTTYYYLLPGISAKEILKFANKTSEVSLVLVSDSPKKIQKKNSETWFKNIHNIQENLILNSSSFELYKSLFSSFAIIKTLVINLDKPNFEKQIELFLGGMKNGNKRISKKSARVLC